MSELLRNEIRLITVMARDQIRLSLSVPVTVSAFTWGYSWCLSDIFGVVNAYLRNAIQILTRLAQWVLLICTTPWISIRNACTKHFTSFWILAIIRTSKMYSIRDECIIAMKIPGTFLRSAILFQSTNISADITCTERWKMQLSESIDKWKYV